MQYVYKQIASYLDEHDATFPIFTDDELRDLAVDKSSVSIAKARLPRSWTVATITNLWIQFLKLVLLVVITPPNEPIFQKLRNLPEPTPQVILRLWKEMVDQPEDEEVDRSSDVGSAVASSNSGSTSSPARTIDRELLLEQHLAELKSKLHRCEAEVEDLREAKEQTDDAYNRLQENYDAVRKDSIEADRQLKKFTAMNNEREQRSVKELVTKISQLEEVIARQETQIIEHQSKEAEMQRKIRKLNAADERLQNLQDDFDVQKMELEHQTRKANAGDKYKQKVQASQNYEKERDSARNELNEARSRLEEAENFRKDNTKLQQENREISQTLSRSERDNTELRETKQAYLSEISRLHHDSKSVREALAQSQDKILDLEEKHGSSERQSSAADGLDAELTEAQNHEQQMQVASMTLLWTRVLMTSRKIRISELEKQVGQLTSDVGDKETKLAMLQGQLERALEDSADQYKKVLETRQEISSLQSALTEVGQGHPIEGSVSAASFVELEAYNVTSTETFKNMRQQIKAQQKQCTHLEEKLSAALKSLKAAESDSMSSFENHCMLTDLTVDLFEVKLVDKSKFQIIQEVRTQDSSAARQLQSEHDALRKRHNRLNDMFVDLTEERNAAWHESHEILLEKGIVEGKAEANTQALRELSDIVRQATTPGSNGGNKDIEIYASKIEDGRERLAKAQQVCKEVLSLDVATETVSLPLQPSSPHSASSSSRFSSPTLTCVSTSSSQFSKGISMLKRPGGWS